MASAMRTYHAGWVISTACWEENPLSWQPGDAPHYCASGKAQLVDPDAYSGAWLSKADIIAPADKDNLFTDSNLAQTIIVKALRELIDALKVP